MDAILDSIGGAYLAGNIESLAQGGRLVLIGLMNGTRAELDLAAVLRRHLKIFGSTLRSRPATEKAQIVSAFLGQFGAALEVRQAAPADLQSDSGRRRLDGASHDAGERAFRQNRSQVRLIWFLDLCARRN